MHRWLDLGFGIGLRPPSFESSLLLDMGEKQEESHSSAVHSSGHIPLTTQRAHFEGRHFMCCVAGGAGQKDLLWLCVYSGPFWTMPMALLAGHADILQLGNAIR